jgi:hypothetical protein
MIVIAVDGVGIGLEPTTTTAGDVLLVSGTCDAKSSPNASWNDRGAITGVACGQRREGVRDVTSAPRPKKAPSPGGWERLFEAS